MNVFRVGAPVFRARLRHVANETFDSRAVKANRSRFHDPMSWTDAFFFHDGHLNERVKRTTECQHDVPHPPRCSIESFGPPNALARGGPSGFRQRLAARAG